jgi:hypothetical protein
LWILWILCTLCPVGIASRSVTISIMNRNFTLRQVRETFPYPMPHVYIPIPRNSQTNIVDGACMVTRSTRSWFWFSYACVVSRPDIYMYAAPPSPDISKLDMRPLSLPLSLSLSQSLSNPRGISTSLHIINHGCSSRPCSVRCSHISHLSWFPFDWFRQWPHGRASFSFLQHFSSSRTDLGLRTALSTRRPFRQRLTSPVLPSLVSLLPSMR